MVNGFKITTMRFSLAVILSIFFMTCSNNHSPKTFDLQGHRGARGLMPENTIPGFLKALDLGVNTLEMDVVVTKDDQIVVSHEPWFNHDITMKPDGSTITEHEEMELNIYEMNYDQVQQYDVGKKGHPSFPNQERLEATKPLLRDVIQTVENYTAKQDVASVKYNIEMKSEPGRYGTYYPEPREFARLLNRLLMRLNEEFEIEDRIIIQSFDPSALIAFHNVNPNIKLAMLVANNQSIEDYVRVLGFTPQIWSPNYQLVSPELISAAHEKGMKVIPWTVNTTEEMSELISMGVDGIITDYPDSAVVIQR